MPDHDRPTSHEESLTDPNSSARHRHDSDETEDDNQPPQTNPVPAALLNIPGYDILDELGRGGMGVVYKARQRSLKRLVALKMIRDGLIAGPEQLARLRQEAEAVAHLDHPNIVHVYEFGIHLGLPFFSMEYVEGGSLDHQRDGEPLPPPEAAVLVLTLAQAMHYAHGQGIVHRDLKPLNVLMKADGTPKITDFGLAKRLDASQSTQGGLKGTVAYMAPEQAGGSPHPIGPAADIYALGAILYEVLTGQPPFQGETLAETLDLVRYREPQPPSSLLRDLPRDLDTICLKCLEKDPTKRYASAQALANDLQAFLDGKPIHGQSSRQLLEERLQRILSNQQILDWSLSASSPVAHQTVRRLLENLGIRDWSASARDSWAARAGYELLGPMGRKDRAILYLAREIDGERLLTVKVLTPGSDRERIAELRAEADALARLKHPLIPDFHAVGEQDGYHYLAFEFVEGVPLARQLSTGPLAIGAGARLVEKLARGLHCAHEGGIVHQELRPTNILLKDGEPKLLNLGVPRKSDDSNLSATQLVNMLKYMAPEQAASEATATTTATNIYALGAILYETLTGRPPHVMASFWGGLQQLLGQNPQAPSDFRPGIPAALDGICLTCLMKDPYERYANTALLADDLGRFRETWKETP